jgi:hypothetical protein
MKTNLLRDDPMLWFSMMVMPSGPPALIISGLAELGKVSETEKMAISKVLAVSNPQPCVIFWLTFYLDHVRPVAIYLFHHYWSCQGF